MYEIYYKLENGEVLPASAAEASGLFNKRRTVAEDLYIDGVNTIRLVTSFIPINMSHVSGPPIVFETMCFGGPMNDYQQRYSTLKEALWGHFVAEQSLIASFMEKENAVREELPKGNP